MPTVFSNPPRKGQPARIWHLDEVLELARQLPVFQKSLAELQHCLEEVAWWGDAHHYGRLTVREVTEHARRIQAADLARPIVLSAEGWLMDGFHRVAKAQLQGVEALPAVQFESDPPPNRSSTWHEWQQMTLRD